jgi:cation diffusion facilitator CzcD-associated flavoprotein CzcO
MLEAPGKHFPSRIQYVAVSRRDIALTSSLGLRYWNRYPGIQCDVDSYIYMPLLEEVGSRPTQKYVSGAELLRHARTVADKYGLRQKTLFQTRANLMKWDGNSWKVETDRGDKIRAHWLVTALGAYHSPKFPGIPGINKFKRKSFHSSRWDWDYTGGNVEQQDMTKLKDKRVVIIGTGATSIQIVPQLAKWAQELYVVQRTPSSVDVRGNKPTDKEWFDSLHKGWQVERQANFNDVTSGGEAKDDLVDDGWTTTLREMPGFFGAAEDGDSAEAQALKLQIADFQIMERLRQRIDDIVEDKKTAESLKPWYNLYCKRPCFHDEYLSSFNSPNVHLVDTEGRGVDAITARGIIVHGKEIQADCIVYATGFEWGGKWTLEHMQTDIIGRDGISLTRKFHAEGPAVYHGWAVHGFPNLAILSWTQAGVTPNTTYTMVEMTQHLVYLMKQCKERRIISLEPTKEAEEEWVREVIEAGAGRNQFLKACPAGFYNNEGDTSEKATRTLHYRAGTIKHMGLLRRWRAAVAGQA